MLRSIDRLIGSIAQDGGSYLGRLRTAPAATVANVSIAVRQSVHMGQTVGGACTIFCRNLGVNFYELEAAPGTGDYFFPYVSAGPGGVGSVQVPRGVAIGTIVLTNSMNGCAVQVNERADHYEFYHDNNSNSMGAASGASAETIAHYEQNRIFRHDAAMYWQPSDDQAMAGGQMPRYQYIFVRTSAGWTVIRSNTIEARGGQRPSGQGSSVVGAIIT